MARIYFQRLVITFPSQ